MNSWITIVLPIAGVLIIIGNAFDKLMVRRQKRIVFDSLVKWWDKLSDIRFPILHQKMATNTISIIHKSTSGRYGKVKAILLSLIISWFLTSVFTYFGFVVRDGGFLAPFKTIASGIPLPVFIVYVTNYIFDFLTLFITYIAIVNIIKEKLLKALVIIALDVMLAVILAILSLSFITWSGDISFNNNMWGTHWTHDLYKHTIESEYNEFHSSHGFSENAKVTNMRINPKHNIIDYLYITPQIYIKFYEDLKNNNFINNLDHKSINSIHYSISENNNYKELIIEWRVSHVFYLFTSLTTLLPTIIYMGYLLFLALSRTLIEILRLSSMQFLEASTEIEPAKNLQDFAPGRLLSIVLGVFVAIINMISKLVSGK